MLPRDFISQMLFIELCDNKTLKKFRIIFFYKNKAKTEKFGFKGKAVEPAKIIKNLTYIISCDKNKSSRSPDHHTGNFCTSKAPGLVSFGGSRWS